MTKAGDAYQEVVGVVEQAFNSGAKVTVGGWIEGPDGRRDMDVSVQGSTNGTPHFALIECKDHKDPVGIGYIDALDSKRRDLGTDAAILYSALGFTRDALRKARRVGIGAVSAMVMGDARVKIVVQKTVVAKRLSVDGWEFLVSEPEGIHSPLVEGFKPDEITYEGLPVQNWISEISKQLVLEHEGASEILAVYPFNHNEELCISGQPVILAGVAIKLQCSRTWVAQDVRVDISRGRYDYLRKMITIPSNEYATIGWFDNSEWQETDQTWDEQELEPESNEVSVKISVTLIGKVAPIEGYGTPAV